MVLTLLLGASVLSYLAEDKRGPKTNEERKSAIKIPQKKDED